MARILPRQRWEQLAEEANFDAKELARLCQLSVRQLQREFRRCLGRSPQDWLNERRLCAAREKLLSGMPVKAVAYELGFKQPSHFTRQFKELIGMTPSEYLLAQISSVEGCRSQIKNVAEG